MVFSSAEVILFGIQAGVRLFGAARQSYIDKTREREVTLPLPGIDHAASVGQAQAYFMGDADGRRHLADPAAAGLRQLHADVMQDRGAFEQDAVRSAEYAQAFVYFRGIDKGLTQDGLAPADILALTTIAQWKKGETPHPTALKRIGGTLVEIGVDYFAEGPGRSKLNGEAPVKRLLREVLGALDDHKFATEGLDGVVETAFLAVLDAVATDGTLLVDDPKLQAFAGAVAKGLVVDVRDRLEQLPEEQRLFAGGQLRQTAGLVLRSLLRHGARQAIENPEALLSVEAEAEGAVISRVGAAVLDTILPGADGRLDLRALVGAEGIDRIVRAAVAVAAEHPDLLGLAADGNSGLRQLLADVAERLLADTRRIGPDLLPEITRLVLERTAGRLPLMWKVDSDEEHLLVTGVSALLTSLSRRSGSGVDWPTALSRRTLLDVTEAVIDEVASNPALITCHLHGKVPLRVAIEAALAELAALDLAEVPPDSVAHILKVSVRAAARRIDFLDRFRLRAGKTKAALGHVLEAVLDAAFPADGQRVRSSWTLAKVSVLEAVTEIVFDELARVGVTAERILALRRALDKVVASIEQQGSFSLAEFEATLRTELAA